MATRIITATIAHGDLTDHKDGGYARFSVTSDTGAVAGALVTTARLFISKFRSYTDTYRLHVKYDTQSGDALASTDAMGKDDTAHAETVELIECTSGLIASTPTDVYLVVESTEGTGNKVNFREGCAITLEIDYATPCTPPSEVKLSASETSDSYNMHVLLSWGAGSGGDDNPVSYYEVARSLSTDGVTWGEMSSIASLASPMSSVFVGPPMPFGAHYRYYVRTVGTAGEDYASEWVASDTTLKKVPPVLLAYTDENIVPGITRVKAVHIQELQENINRVRAAYGFGVYQFSDLRAGYTDLKFWTAHITELREAIDETGAVHRTWVAILVNCPRKAVMLQLRRIIAELAGHEKPIDDAETAIVGKAIAGRAIVGQV